MAFAGKPRDIHTPRLNDHRLAGIPVPRRDDQGPGRPVGQLGYRVALKSRGVVTCSFLRFQFFLPAVFPLVQPARGAIRKTRHCSIPSSLEFNH